MNERCFLQLSDGALFAGRSFGSFPPRAYELQQVTVPSKAVGELVFNTAMSGYHEVLTDPSYSGQLVTMTYPMIGNYGTDESWNENGPEPADKVKIKAAGLVVRARYDPWIVFSR